MSVPSTLFPRVRRSLQAVAEGWNRIGSQTQFYFLTIRGLSDSLAHYKIECMRLLAQMSLGIANLKLGKKADAVKAFEQVKNDEPMADVARLWTIVARSGTS